MSDERRRFSEQEAVIGCVLWAEASAREGVEVDKIDEAITEISRYTFHGWDPLATSKIWLRLQDEIPQMGLGPFFSAVNEQVGITVKFQIGKICFDLIRMNPLLDPRVNDYLLLLVKGLELPSDTLAALWTEATRQQYVRYTNDPRGITLDAPKGWVLNEEAKNSIVLSLYRPPMGSVQYYPDHFDLIFEEGSKHLTDEQFKEQSLKNWNDVFTDFEYLNDHRLRIPEHGIHGHLMILRGTLPRTGDKLRVRFYSFRSELHDLRYTLSCLSLEDSYWECEDIFEHVARSLVINRT